jgi:hypothetical protein
MSASLRALLAGVLDYAGLFPPARLPLEPAIRNYARYRGEPEGWMLGRFVCPAARLGELSPFVEELFPLSGPPLAVAVLGRGGETVAEFMEGLRADLGAESEFSGQHGDRVSVDMLELRLPADVLPPAPPKKLGALRGSLGPDLIMWDFRGRKHGFKVLYEVSLGPDWRAWLTTALRLLPEGFKLRCGGPEAAAFPTSEQVAGVLTACARRNVPFKATAGLHHPIRHFDAKLQTPVHGFLNVFGAGVLAAALRLRERTVQTIIEDEDPSHFVFTDDAFRWKDKSAPVEAIVRARRDRVVSFGSCSFDEPRDDLRALGLLR